MIRYLEKNEKLNIRSIYEQCFQDSKEYTDYYMNNCLKNNFVAVDEEDGEIIGAVHLIPKTVTTGKLKTNVFYIYGVSTLEKYRRKGVMKSIFKYILSDMYEDMEAFTYLIPSDETNAMIYRKLGFEYVMDKELQKKEEARKKPSHSLILRKAEPSDFPRLAIFAESAIEERYDVSLTKNRDYLKKMNDLLEVEDGRIEIYVENKVVVGYRIVVDDEAIEEVLDNETQSMTWLLNEKKPYAMARIINLRKTLRLIGMRGVGQFVIEIEDSVLPGNNGRFKISYEHTNIKMEPTTEEAEFHVTIGQLTQHVFGYKLIDGLPEVCMKHGFFINDYV